MDGILLKMVDSEIIKQKLKLYSFFLMNFSITNRIES